MPLPPEVSRSLHELWNDLEQSGRRREAEAAKAAPATHKLTTVFENGMRWLYFKPVRTRGRETRFCYSTTRNVAGYFLTWREVRGAKHGKRDMFRASKRRKTVEGIAQKRASALRAKTAKT